MTAGGLIIVECWSGKKLCFCIFFLSSLAVIYSLGTRRLVLVPSKELSVGLNVKIFLNANVIKC